MSNLATLGAVAQPGEVVLSTDQEAALNACIEAAKATRKDHKGRVIFVTGKAGTGKSTILRELRQRMRTVVVAPTGLAAVNVGGETIHRFFGLPIGPLTRGKCKSLREEKQMVVERADVIAIDEISMVRADLLDGINWVLQKTFETVDPFGGKCIVVIGDMMQLEPVVPDDVKEWLDNKYQSPFWFDAAVFNGETNLLEDAGQTVNIERHELGQVFRQIGHDDFIAALNAIRVGDPSGIAFINERSRASLPISEMPVSLTFGNRKAESINATRLAGLVSDSRTFPAQVDGDFGVKDIPVATDLQLKVGAQVMFARNVMDMDGRMIANGTVGEVVAFAQDLPVVALRDGRVTIVGPEKWEKISYAFDVEKDKITEEVKGTFSQIPLKLAWAVTTHKSQGQTLDSAILEMEMPAFAHGQLYVALSRVKRPDGLFMRRRLQPTDLIIHDRIREWCGLPTFDKPAAQTLNLGAFAQVAA